MQINDSLLIPEHYRYIIVEGPIGAGKTTLARMLAKRLGCSTLLENPESNVFLPSFYRDIHRYALPTQLTFLFQRVKQVQQLIQDDLFHTRMVSDFILEKDPLFARLTLNDEELSLYQEVFERLRPPHINPDLVIYLQASSQTLIDRVHLRGIDYEQDIPEEYLANLAESYSRFFYRYDASPL